jgi:hypothetical protein
MGHFTDVLVTDTFDQWRVKTNNIGEDVTALIDQVDSDLSDLNTSVGDTVTSLNSSFVSLATTQTIDGSKTFSSSTIFNEPAVWTKEYTASDVTPMLELKVTNSTPYSGSPSYNENNPDHRGTGPSIDFYNPDVTTSGNTWLTSRIASVCETTSDAAPDASLIFYTGKNTEDIIEKMRITSNGAVGIGTDAPDTNGKFTVKDEANANNNTLFKLSSFKPNIVLEDNSSGTSDYKILVDSGKLSIFNGNTNGLTFTNVNECLRVDANGTITMNGGISVGTNTAIIADRSTANLDTLRLWSDDDISLRTGVKGTTLGNERLKISSIGNVLIGTTDVDPWTSTSGGGTVIRQDGVVGISHSDGTPLFVNRTGTVASTIGDFRVNGESKILLGSTINSGNVERTGSWLRLGNSSTVGYSQIQFGDTDDYNVGLIHYEHNGDTMQFNVGGAQQLKIYSDGTATLPNATIAELNNRGGTAIPTKQYVDHYWPGEIVQQQYVRVDKIQTYEIDATAGRLSTTAFATPGRDPASTTDRVVNMQGLNFTRDGNTSQPSMYARGIDPLRVSITPRFANSLIVVEMNISGETGAQDSGLWMGQETNSEYRLITRTGYEGYNPKRATGRNNFYYSGWYDGDTATTMKNMMISYIDKPNTTSAITYLPIYGSPHSGASNRRFYLNRTANTTNTGYNSECGVSTISIKEIRQ